jgi:hypothetical protein
MSEPARHLQIVNPDTGEVSEQDCPGCVFRADVIEGLEGEIRSLAAKITALKRDKEEEAKRHPLWPTAWKVFKAWKKLGNHGRAAWGADRFDLIRPFLQDKAYGKTIEERELMCLRGVAGITFDPYTSRRANGSMRRHDGWDLLFRGRDKFEEMCNRAPKDWQQRVVEATGHALVVEVEAA